MNPFNSNFDPFEALEQLNKNQHKLYENQEQLNQNFRVLAKRINEQQEIIDTLLKSIETLNKTNELALQQLVASMVSNNYSAQGQH